jgi:D-arabinitol dehydrogenase (NADP+)
MKAVVYDSAKNFTIKDIPTPEPKSGEVLVKIELAGVCGTDLHIHEGDFLAEFPLIPGHEMVGIVSALGAGVNQFKVGERVTVNPVVSCGDCEFCREGKPILCHNRKGLGTNWPGSFAEYMIATEDLVFKVGNLSPDVAVFAEPAACAMHGAQMLGIKPGSSALIFGAGPTGQLLAQLMATSGAASVTVAGSTQFKLDLAKKLGADKTYLMDRNNVAKTKADLLKASPSGYDIVVEATGSMQVAEICVPLTRSGGTFMVYGVAEPDETFKINAFDVFHREIRIQGSFAEIDTLPATLAALESGRLKTDGLITHRFSIDEYGKALEALRSDKSAHKIVLKF